MIGRNIDELLDDEIIEHRRTDNDDAESDAVFDVLRNGKFFYDIFQNIFSQYRQHDGEKQNVDRKVQESVDHRFRVAQS